MPSMYNGIALFGSGPHRFIMERQGQAELPPATVLSLGQPTTGWFQLGLVQLSVRVRGRLVAASEADLWTLRDALSGAITATTSSATLEDGNGRTWPSMWLVRYEEKGPVDVGRTWSIGYEAIFRKVGQ